MPTEQDREADGLGLDDHLRGHVVGTGDQLARLRHVVGSARAAEVRVDEDARADGADDAADAMDTEHVEAVVVAEQRS